jgi:hypothetical protein
MHEIVMLYTYVTFGLAGLPERVVSANQLHPTYPRPPKLACDVVSLPIQLFLGSKAN